MKTRQVTYSVLNHLIGYVQNLEKVGLLEEKEMLHLHDAVQVSNCYNLAFQASVQASFGILSIVILQTDLKRLLRNPPLVKFPKVSSLVNAHPLLGALPSNVRERLTSSTKELTKLSGVTLYKEGARPNGVWLVSNGIVKVKYIPTQTSLLFSASRNILLTQTA